MNSNLEKSIILISSCNSNTIGTGFIIHRDNQAVYILTCVHVVCQIGEESLKANGLKAEVVARGEDNGLDLAVLKVKDLNDDWKDRPILSLSESALEGDRFEVVKAFRNFSASSLPKGERLEGNLAEKGTVDSREGISFSVWPLKVDNNQEIKEGYSGSPLFHLVSGYVIGIVSHNAGEKDNFSGLAISVEALKYIWKNMPFDLMKENPISLENEKAYFKEVNEIISKDYLSHSLAISKPKKITFDEGYQTILEQRRKELQLSEETARQLEYTAYKPYLEYEEKIRSYKKNLAKKSQVDNGTLKESSRSKLSFLQKKLNLDDQGVALAYISLGEEFIKKDDYLDAAIQQFKVAIEFDDKSATAYYGLGAAFCKKGKRKEAVENLQAAKNLFQESKRSEDQEKAQDIEKLLNQISLDNIWANRAKSFVRGMLILPLFFKK